MVTSLLIDDVRDPLENRVAARTRINAALDEPLDMDSDDEVERLRETWGMSDEAIANQQSSFWDN